MKGEGRGTDGIVRHTGATTLLAFYVLAYFNTNLPFVWSSTEMELKWILLSHDWAFTGRIIGPRRVSMASHRAPVLDIYYFGGFSCAHWDVNNADADCSGSDNKQPS